MIALLVGGGSTESAVEHRLRPIKQLGKLQVDWFMNKRKDPGELPVEGGGIFYTPLVLLNLLFLFPLFHCYFL